MKPDRLGRVNSVATRKLLEENLPQPYQNAGSDQNDDVSQRACLASRFEYVCAGFMPRGALDDLEQ